MFRSLIFFIHSNQNDTKKKPSIAIKNSKKLLKPSNLLNEQHKGKTFDIERNVTI